MREILFRGKRKYNGEWVEGFYLQGVDNKGALCHMIKTKDDTCFVISSTVGQYTGLTDKNGKKIFDGDIWKRGDICGIVRWDFDEARFIVSYEIDGIEYQNAVSERSLKSIEVIGNIHDNSLEDFNDRC